MPINYAAVVILGFVLFIHKNLPNWMKYVGYGMIGANVACILYHVFPLGDF